MNRSIRRSQQLFGGQRLAGDSGAQPEGLIGAERMAGSLTAT